jgi:hypothetical protein
VAKRDVERPASAVRGHAVILDIRITPAVEQPPRFHIAVRLSTPHMVGQCSAIVPGRGMMFQRFQNEDAFHSRAGISQAMELQRQHMREEINRLPEARLESEAVERLAEEMAEKFSINMPVLDEASIQPARREIDIDFSRDPTRRAYYSERGGVVKGTEISISVPFQGDAEVFRLHASSHTMEYPRGRIESAVIVFRRQGGDLDAAQVRREFDEWLAAIKRHLAGMTQELGDFNNHLVAEAVSALNGRAAKLQRDDELLSGLGFASQSQTRPDEQARIRPTGTMAEPPRGDRVYLDPSRFRTRR